MTSPEHAGRVALIIMDHARAPSDRSASFWRHLSSPHGMEDGSMNLELPPHKRLNAWFSVEFDIKSDFEASKAWLAFRLLQLSHPSPWHIGHINMLLSLQVPLIEILSQIFGQNYCITKRMNVWTVTSVLVGVSIWGQALRIAEMILFRYGWGEIWPISTIKGSKTSQNI